MCTDAPANSQPQLASLAVHPTAALGSFPEGWTAAEPAISAPTCLAEVLLVRLSNHGLLLGCCYGGKGTAGERAASGGGGAAGGGGSGKRREAAAPEAGEERLCSMGLVTGETQGRQEAEDLAGWGGPCSRRQWRRRRRRPEAAATMRRLVGSSHPG